MRLSHIMLAVLVMAIWGVSFVAIAEGLHGMPPLLLCGLRFLLTSIPSVFFIKRPAVSWWIIASYGLLMFVGMFAFTFLSIHAGITPGLAALLIQLQIFFTVLLARLFFKEYLTRWQIIGAIISFTGLAIIGLHSGKNITLTGLFCMVGAALCWSFANITSKKAGKINMLALIVWGSLFAWPILFVLSLIFEGTSTIIYHLQHISFLSMSMLIYMAYPATLLGFTIWGWLLSNYRAATITPFGLLVPFFGILASVLLLHESVETWKLIAAIFIMSGLMVNIFGMRCMFLIRRFIFFR